MAAGDVYVVGPTSVSAGGYLTVQPGSGVEVAIHNIHVAEAAQIEIYDGTNAIIVDVATTRTTWVGLTERLTNGVYMRIKNNDDAAQYIHVSGVQTK